MVLKQSAFPSIPSLRDSIGVVIPTWVPPDTPQEEIEHLLRLTLTDSELFVPPERCLIVADGSPIAHQAARMLESEGKARIVESIENLGKAGAVALGMSQLLENDAMQFVAVRDHDNDHLAHELPALHRMALQIQQETRNEMVAVIGGRSSIQRHLGFARGEFEAFGNEVTFTVVQMALAREDRAIDGRFWSAYGLIPDLQSGYKLYSRSAATLFIETLREGIGQWPALQLGHGASCATQRRASFVA